MPPSSPYALALTRAAEKDLDDLRTYRRKVLGALRALRTAPYTGHALAGNLKGVRSLEFSLPGGAYRAAYVLDEARLRCLVIAVGPHENFYRLAERRFASLRRSMADDARASDEK